MKFRYAMLGLFLVSIVSAEALLVTVEYNQGNMGIRYVELFAGPEPGYSSDGDYILAYETPSGTIPGTAFNMPLVTSTQEQELLVSEQAEQTLMIPYEPSASSLSLYNIEGELLASFSLSGISQEGDYSGAPPSESIAGKSGQPSVSAGLEEAAADDDAGGTPVSAPGGEDCCGTAFILLAALLFAGRV